MPSSRRSEKSIFAEALDKRSAEERAAFLDGACGPDAALRARVEKPTPVSRTSRQFPTETACRCRGLAWGDDETPLAEQPGMVVGPYKLIEQLGEGGMDLVFVAEQQHPVRRKVAFKIIKPDMDRREVIPPF
jgi:eukaryotic-like serine/threonine-protein kinase